MRVRIILLCSLGLNLVLAVMFFYARQQQETGITRAPANAVRTAEPATNNVKTHVVVRRQFFSWGEIESTDYPTYIANLRSIGCPEATIRDIIVAEVNQLYARKRTTEILTTDQQWWRSEPDLDVIQASVNKQRALDTERHELLTSLLGPNWETAATVDQGAEIAVPLNGPILGELAPEVKRAVQEISAQSQKRQQAYREAQTQAGAPVDPAEMARLRQQTRNELARVLTLTQLEEYLLRYSHTANKLREDLHGFSATPDEFRRIFRLVDPIEQRMELYYAGNDPISASQRQQLEEQRLNALKQAVSPERWKSYELLHDPVYIQTQTTVQRLGVPADAIMPIYQVNQLISAEQQRIKNDPTLTVEERELALQLVKQEQQKSLEQLLRTRFNTRLPTNEPLTPLLPPLPEPPAVP